MLAFCPSNVFMCFVWIWEQTAIISLYSINWLVCVTETECVYCAVRTGCLYHFDAALKPGRVDLHITANCNQRRLTPTRAFTCTPHQCILISRVKCEFYCRPPGSVLVHFQKPNKVFITYKTENQISLRRFRCVRCLAEFAAYRGTAPLVMALNNAWSTVRANIWPRISVYGLCTDDLRKMDCCSKW